MHIVAMTLARMKEHTEAETLYRDALTRLRRASTNALRLEIPLLGMVLHHLGNLLREEGKLGDARTVIEDVGIALPGRVDLRAIRKQVQVVINAGIDIDGELRGLAQREEHSL